jgi:hypothetical protein
MVTSASTFIITMCLPAEIVAIATSAPTFGFPVASITTSTSGDEHTSRKDLQTARRPREMEAGDSREVVGHFGGAPSAAGNGARGEYVLGDHIRNRDDLDAGHLFGLHEDVGAHLSGADQPDAHGLSLATPPIETFGDRAAGSFRGNGAMTPP